MKLKMVIATLVCGMAFCSNSYGFELLDRMMGRAGCDGCATSCCDTPVNAGCGCDAQTNCCDNGCGMRCHKFGNFFNRGCGGCGLFGGGCCGAVDAGCGCNGGNVGAGCGCDNGCDSGCCGNGCGLLDRIRARHASRHCGGCCGAVVSPNCGCNGATTSDAPQVVEPPADAPVADPNAFIVPNRRIAGGAR